MIRKKRLEAEERFSLTWNEGLESVFLLVDRLDRGVGAETDLSTGAQLLHK